MLSNSLIKQQLEDVSIALKEIGEKVEVYANEHSLSSWLAQSNMDQEYGKLIWSAFRKLVVYTNESAVACQWIAANEPFSKQTAEQVLYKVYHQCVEEFFSPKTDVWYENSRSAYTGRNAIKFHQDVPSHFQELIKEIEQPFQSLREELEYYETDYRTKMVQSTKS